MFMLVTSALSQIMSQRDKMLLPMSWKKEGYRSLVGLPIVWSISLSSTEVMQKKSTGDEPVF
jgi:hypothetical protein